MKSNRRILLTIVTTLFGIALSTQSAMATYLRITLNNLSPNVLTPAPFITHDSSFDLFDQNSSASPAVEALAEGGDTSGVVALAAFAKGSGSVLDYKIAANGGPIFPAMSATVDIKADPSHRWLSFLSMFAVSNDAFIGGTTGDNAIELFSGATPLYNTYFIAPADVWDAGTEVNDELRVNVPGAFGGTGGVDENGVITNNHPGIAGIPGMDHIPSSFDWTAGNPAYVASITISKSPVPEPATMVLFGAGLAGLAGFSARRRQNK